MTEQAAQALLRRGPARSLDGAEEKVVRMRLGASLPLSARLDRIAVATDVEIEVLAYEIEAWLHAKEKVRPCATVTLAEPRQAPAPAASRAKEKIVRALRKK
ncbi:MAG TPA: hypothetical protein VF341_01495 [Anaeromyxobacteraceae bacterium]